MSIKRKHKEIIPNARLFQDVSPVIRTNDDSGSKPTPLFDLRKLISSDAT
jgi:hypothetical protein